MIGTPGRFCWRLDRFPPDALSWQDRETWYHTHATDHVAYPQRPSRTFMAPHPAAWKPAGGDYRGHRRRVERGFGWISLSGAWPCAMQARSHVTPSWVSSPAPGGVWPRLWRSSASKTVARHCGASLSSERWRYDLREGPQGPAVLEGFPRTTGQAYTRSAAVLLECMSSSGLSPAHVIPPTRHNHNHCEAWKWAFVQARSGSKLWVTHNASPEGNSSGDVQR